MSLGRLANRSLKLGFVRRSFARLWFREASPARRLVVGCTRRTSQRTPTHQRKPRRARSWRRTTDPRPGVRPTGPASALPRGASPPARLAAPGSEDDGRKRARRHAVVHSRIVHFRLHRVAFVGFGRVAQSQFNKGYDMKKMAVIALAAALTACGGGGDDNPAKSAGAAEGFWSGPASSGVDVSVAVLENGETWAVYESGGSIVGAINGTLTINGANFTGSGKDFDLIDGSVVQGTFTGAAIAKTSLSISTSSGATVNTVYEAAYDQPATLASIAGTFAGSGVSATTSAQSISLTISPTGALTIPGTAGCSAAGTVAPRASGKNVFNLSITFTGANCAIGNGVTTTGIAVYNTTTGSLIALALNSAKSDGVIYLGSKAL